MDLLGLIMITYALKVLSTWLTNDQLAKDNYLNRRNSPKPELPFVVNENIMSD